MEKMLMNTYTGSVAPESEWRKDFESMTAEEWGGNSFECADLIEVVANVEGEDGYDPDAGEWREAE